MSKGRAVAQRQARSKGDRRSKWSPLWVFMVVGGLALAVAVGLSVYFSQGRQSSSTIDLPSSGVPLDVAAIGKSAPGFSLLNQYGQTYTLAPGDGKNHLLLFYMGNF